MSLYRVKQFYWSITSRLEEKDYEIINRFLDKEEIRLFNSIPVYEQKHCIKVAMNAIELCKNNNINNREILIKAALLHDIGKSCKTLNPFEKSIMVILDKVSKGKLKRYNNIRKIDIYYNHADIGYRLLKRRGCYEERLLYLIKNHHNSDIINDKELEILKISDSSN